MKHLSIIILVTLSISCKNTSKQLNAQTIIDKSISISGGDKFSNSTIEFDFREKHYKALRNNGIYKLTRAFTDSLGIYKDILSNKGFQRFLNDELIEINDTMAPRYSRSVNSVHYFSVLPYGLNDPAVNKFYLGEVIINEKAYHKIKVTFNKDGGGDDFDDEFVYWVNTKDFKADYLAYSYKEANGDLGFRFREAYNERFVSDLRFVDYNNYKPKNSNIKLSDLDKSFENGVLQLVSRIELKNLSVK